MPIYDTRCNDCGAEKDVLVRSWEAELPTCECGGSTSRLISTPSFMFAQPAGTDKGRLMQINPRKTKRTTWQR